MAIKIKKKVKREEEEVPEVSEEIAEPDGFVKASLGLSAWMQKNWKAVSVVIGAVVVLALAIHLYLDYQRDQHIAASSELTKAVVAYNTPLADEAAFVRFRSTYDNETARSEAVYQLATAAVASHGESAIVGEAHLLAASAAQRLGKTAEAGAQIEAAMGKLDDSVDVFALQARASILADEGKTDEAAQAYRQVHDKAPAFYGPFALMQIGLLQERAGKPKEAADAFAELAAHFPDDRLASDARRHLGVLVADPEAAISAIPL